MADGNLSIIATRYNFCRAAVYGSRDEIILVIGMHRQCIEINRHFLVWFSWIAGNVADGDLAIIYLTINSGAPTRSQHQSHQHHYGNRPKHFG